MGVKDYPVRIEPDRIRGRRCLGADEPGGGIAPRAGRLQVAIQGVGGAERHGVGEGLVQVVLGLRGGLGLAQPQHVAAPRPRRLFALERGGPQDVESVRHRLAGVVETIPGGGVVARSERATNNLAHPAARDVEQLEQQVTRATAPSARCRERDREQAATIRQHAGGETQP